VQGRDADRLWICESGAVIVLQYEAGADASLASTTAATRGAMRSAGSRKLARYSRISTASHPAEPLDVQEEGPVRCSTDFAHFFLHV
jgi:hypothetical protein